MHCDQTSASFNFRSSSAARASIISLSLLLRSTSSFFYFMNHTAKCFNIWVSPILVNKILISRLTQANLVTGVWSELAIAGRLCRSWTHHNKFHNWYNPLFCRSSQEDRLVLRDRFQCRFITPPGMDWRDWNCWNLDRLNQREDKKSYVISTTMGLERIYISLELWTKIYATNQLLNT